MGKYNFGEKTTEWSVKQGKEIPVWATPKYSESKKKAVELLDSGKYGLAESDFWILMNETKSGKMAYSGLIISHNGCLKINDALDSRFMPDCVSEDKDAWGGTLLMRYCSPEQGVYEVGEVSTKNCKNDYPYAMAFKRLFDRVVLKLSKIAYAGIYSETEADEFRDPMIERKEEKKSEKKSEKKGVLCERCGEVIEAYTGKSGRKITPEMHADYSKNNYGGVYCIDCIKVLKTAQDAETARHKAAMGSDDE